ncbi:MAG: phosphatase PAP2 family protein, partial [Actinomycetota bacterium]
DDADRDWLPQVRGSPGSPTVHAAVAIAWAGSGPVTAAAGTLLCLRRHGRRRGTRVAVRWLLAVGAGGAVEAATKTIVARPGPTPVVTDVAAARVGIAPGSFPSGHVITAVLAGALLARLHPTPWARAAAAAWPAVIAWSRLTLAAHWPADVAGGALAGIAVALCWAALTARRTPGAP